MRHFLLLSTAMPLLSGGMPMPTLARLLVPFSRSAQALLPGFVGAAGGAVPLAAVTAAADEYDAATALTAVEPKRSQLQAHLTARMTGASAASCAVAV